MQVQKTINEENIQLYKIFSFIISQYQIRLREPWNFWLGIIFGVTVTSDQVSLAGEINLTALSVKCEFQNICSETWSILITSYLDFHDAPDGRRYIED